jgi:segregation and condensation protein B
VLLKHKSNKKLSRSALETLAVIAYQQPVSKGEVEKIRGVNCDYAVQKLLEKELIQIKGRSKDPGRPLLYGTSDKFMEHFGLPALQDLPKLKEFLPEDNQIGLAEDTETNQ